MIYYFVWQIRCMCTIITEARDIGMSERLKITSVMAASSETINMQLKLLLTYFFMLFWHQKIMKVTFLRSIPSNNNFPKFKIWQLTKEIAYVSR
jgi:hypothetical protein